MKEVSINESDAESILELLRSEIDYGDISDADIYDEYKRVIALLEELIG